MLWVAYEAVSGDVVADGSERLVRRYVDLEDKASEGQHTLVAASEADWRRDVTNPATRSTRMSGNPPRRNPPHIEHLPA